MPVTFLVLRNEEYMILKWFAEFEQASGLPGLDLPGLDVAAVAAAYGVPSREVQGAEELIEALREAIAAQDGPRLVQVPVRQRHVAGVSVATARGRHRADRARAARRTGPVPRPAPDAAPDWVAHGTPPELAGRAARRARRRRASPAARSDLIRYASDASPLPLDPARGRDPPRHRARSPP